MAKTLANLVNDSRLDKDGNLRTITVDKAKAPEVYNAIVNDEVTLIDSVLLVLIDENGDSEVVVCNKDIKYSEAVKVDGSGGTPTPVEVSWDDVTDKPTTFAPIVGTTADTAKAGDWTPAVGDIPNLSTSKITSGTFADARIPALAISKITNLQTTLDGKQASLPTAPATGTFVLTSTDGVLSWEAQA